VTRSDPAPQAGSSRTDRDTPAGARATGLFGAGLRQLTGLMVEALQARIQLAEHDWRELRAQLLRRGLLLAMTMLCLAFLGVALQAWIVMHWWTVAGPASLLVLAAAWGLLAVFTALLLTLDLKASGWAVLRRR